MSPIRNVCRRFVGTHPNACRACGFDRADHGRVLSPAEREAQQPVLALHVEQERARADELRTVLQTLHDEVVDYLAARDLEVVHLPESSPLRRAIEQARDHI